LRDTLKILVVNNSLTMRMFIKMQLNRIVIEKLQIYEAGNGVEALSIIDKHSPNIVLSDWKMPEMTGVELLQEINKKGLKLKFGFITSEGTPDMKKLAKDNGALFFIHKPFNLTVLNKKLEEILS